MGVSLEKLLSYGKNKYIFSKAAMKAIEKMGNMKGPQTEINENEKIVIKALNLVLDEKIKFLYKKDNK